MNILEFFGRIDNTTYMLWAAGLYLLAEDSQWRITRYVLIVGILANVANFVVKGLT